MSSVTTSFYGINPNDDHNLHQNFMASIDANSNLNMDSGEPFYPTPFDEVPAPSFPNPNNISATQSPHGELPAFLMNGVTDGASLGPVFPTYNIIPYFPTPFPFAMASNLLFSGLRTSPEGTLAPSPGPSHGNLPKPNLKSRDIYTKRTAAYVAKSKRIAHTRRTRGPTRNTSSRRPYGAGYGDMFNKLPLEVQRALNTFYTGCCESMTDRDNSTRQKHMFSNRHCKNLPKEYLDILPCFVCPAYIALHGACEKANGGRYDSAERHCGNCAGFKEMSSKFRMFPLEITKEEHKAMESYRGMNKKAKDEEKTKRLVRNSVNKLLRMMVGHDTLQIHEAESNFSGVINAASVSLGMMPWCKPNAAVEQVGTTFTPRACSG